VSEGVVRHTKKWFSCCTTPSNTDRIVPFCVRRCCKTHIKWITCCTTPSDTDRIDTFCVGRCCTTHKKINFVSYDTFRDKEDQSYLCPRMPYNMKLIFLCVNRPLGRVLITAVTSFICLLSRCPSSQSRFDETASYTGLPDWKNFRHLVFFRCTSKNVGGSLAAWYSGHRIRLHNRRSWVRIPPGCKVFRNVYIAVLLS
jgi:hypothetical protein